MSDSNSLLQTQQQNFQRRLNAWNKALPIVNYHAAVWRVDAYGSVIKWGEYGKTSKYGWEIDHEFPEVHFPGLAADTRNLRALHWQNNRKKSDKIDLRSLLGGA